jgi:hypothetical protein
LKKEMNPWVQVSFRREFPEKLGDLPAFEETFCCWGLGKPAARNKSADFRML